jgi:hypothetical protein
MHRARLLYSARPKRYRLAAVTRIAAVRYRCVEAGHADDVTHTCGISNGKKNGLTSSYAV